MSQYNSTYEIAEEINRVVGNPTQQFDSVYEICEQIYHSVGGNQTDFDSVYEICAAILEQLDEHPVVDFSLLDEIYYQLTGQHATTTDERELTDKIIVLIQQLQDVATNAEIDLLFV